MPEVGPHGRVLLQPLKAVGQLSSDQLVDRLLAYQPTTTSARQQFRSEGRNLYRLEPELSRDALVLDGSVVLLVEASPFAQFTQDDYLVVAQTRKNGIVNVQFLSHQGKERKDRILVLVSDATAVQFFLSTTRPERDVVNKSFPLKLSTTLPRFEGKVQRLTRLNARSNGRNAPPSVSDAFKQGAITWKPQGEFDPGECTLHITVDVEDKIFPTGCLIQDRDGRWPGTVEIARALRERGWKGTFFVNIYERCALDDPRRFDSVIRELVELDQEIGLHAHPCPAYESYGKDLHTLSFEEQLAILKSGKELLSQVAGRDVVVFRAGGYRYDLNTLRALTELGFQVDSSYLHGQVSEQLKMGTANTPHWIDGIMEVPITSVAYVDGRGGLRTKKLDINWLTVDENMQVVAEASLSGVPVLNFMLHSFSFAALEQIGRGDDYDQEKAKRALLLNKTGKGGRKMAVSGERLGLFGDFERFLEYLGEVGVRVRGMAESMETYRRVAEEPQEDRVPVVFSNAKRTFRELLHR